MTDFFSVCGLESNRDGHRLRSQVTEGSVLARRKQDVSGCVRRRLCGVLSTLSIAHNRSYGLVRSHRHHNRHGNDLSTM